MKQMKMLSNRLYCVFFPLDTPNKEIIQFRKDHIEMGYARITTVIQAWPSKTPYRKIMCKRTGKNYV